MFTGQIRRYLQLQRLATALGGVAFGLLIGVGGNLLSQAGLAWVLVVALLALVSGGAAIVLSLRGRTDIPVDIGVPDTIRTPEEAKHKARRALVCFVPLYTPKRGTPADTLSPQQRMEAVEKLDFDALQLEQSNLEPTIRAVATHAGRLVRCWLLSTAGKDTAGALPYARLLAEYLRQRKGVTCEFSYGRDYCIPLEDDALVLTKTYEQVRMVLQEAAKAKFTPRDMVADITTGFRSMTLGMVLACLSKDRDIQFVGTRYDARGQPTGDLFPIVFSFEPAVPNE